MFLELINYVDYDDVESQIYHCESKKHIQQVAYSTYHKALTQICFTCMKVRTSLNPEDIKEDEKK